MNPTVTIEDVASVRQQIEPELDRAMARLGDAGRSAIALRYLQGHSVAQVGEALGISSDAAAKRIARALDRLRRYLTGRNAMLSAVPLGVVLENLSPATAPAALVEITIATATMPTGVATSLAATISERTINMLMWNKIKAVAILIVAIVGGVGAGMFSLIQLQAQVGGQDPPPVQQLPVVRSDLLSYTARLKNGVGVELIGLAPFPSNGQSWWRADGSSLSRAPYHHIKAELGEPWGDPRMAAGNSVTREIAVRLLTDVTGQPDSAEMRWNLLRASSSYAWIECEDQANQVVPGVYAIASRLPASATTVLRVEIAAQPWKTPFVVSAQLGGEAAAQGKSYVLQKPFETSGETRFTFSRTGIQRGLNERLIAIDTDGRKHLLQLKSTRSSGSNQTDEFFVKAPFGSLKEVQFQERPYDQWLEFRGISLDPGELKEIKIVTSDDPPATRPASLP